MSIVAATDFPQVDVRQLREVSKDFDLFLALDKILMKEKRLTIRLWHLLALAAIPLLYAYFGRYCLPYYDDYPSAIRVARDGIWGNLLARHLVASGRFVHQLVFGFVTLNLEHLWLLRIIPAITIATFLAPVYWIIRLISVNSRRESLFIALLVFVVFFTSYTSLSANLYYLGTVVSYQWSLNAFLVLVAGFLRLADVKRPVRLWLWAVMLISIPVAVTGNELFTLFVLAVLLLVVLVAVVNRHPRGFAYVGVLAVSLIFGGLSLSSPGNFSNGVGVKIDTVFAPRLVDALSGVAVDILGIPLHYLVMPTVFLALLLFAACLEPRRKFNFLPKYKLQAHLIVVGLLLVGCVFFTSMIIRLSNGEQPQGRYLNVITIDVFLFVFLMVVLATENIQAWIRKVLFRKIPPVVILLLFLTILCTVKNNYRLVRDNVTGYHQKHYAGYMNNIALVKEGRGDEVDPSAPSPHAISFRDSDQQFSQELFIEFWSDHTPKTVF